MHVWEYETGAIVTPGGTLASCAPRLHPIAWCTHWAMPLFTAQNFRFVSMNHVASTPGATSISITQLCAPLAVTFAAGMCYLFIRYL